MPQLSDFLTQWGWTETILMCVIISFIVGAREWRHIKPLFTISRKDRRL